MPKRVEPDEVDEIISDKIDGIPPTKWKVIWRKSSLPGILVSESGDLWDSIKGRHPALYKLDHGELVIVVKVGTEYKRETVAKLVYEAFFGPLPKGMMVAHRDGINTNDDLTNLVASSSENTCGRPMHVFKNGHIIRSYPSAAAYARSIGVATSTVQHYLSGHNKTSEFIKEEIGYERPVKRMCEVQEIRQKRFSARARKVEMVRDGDVIKTFPSVQACAKHLDLNPLTVIRILKGKGSKNPYKKIDEIRYADGNVTRNDPQ